MSNGKRISRLKKLLDKYTGEIKEKETRLEQKKEEERKRCKQVEDKHYSWVNELKPEAERSAQVILDWVEEVLKSNAWKDFKIKYGKQISGLGISKNIVYEGPSTNPYDPYGAQGNQSLRLDFSGNLYVNNNVKYGKSHKIRNKKELLKYTDFPVIIKIAETIKDESVWVVIEARLKKEKERRVADLDDKKGFLLLLDEDD